MAADLEFASHILLLSATPAALPDEFFRTCTAGFGRRCVPLRTEGLRVSEATEADVEAMWAERGHRTLVITRKGGKVVPIPLAPRTARAIDLAIGERLEGPIFTTADGSRLDRRHRAGLCLLRGDGWPGRLVCPEDPRDAWWIRGGSVVTTDAVPPPPEQAVSYRILRAGHP
jgi:integrase